MGKLLNGINGPIKGRVGPVIGSSWKGIPYLKGPHKKRTKRISLKEKNNRQKFKVAQYWLKPTLDFVRQGFKGYSLLSEGFVAAKSHLMKNAMEGEGETLRIDPAKVKLSMGDLALPDNVAAEVGEGNEILFTWDPRSVRDANNRDQVMMMAYDVERKIALYITEGQFRSTGRDTLPVYSKSNTKYQVYIAFVAADRSSQSESVYLGEVVH